MGSLALELGEVAPRALADATIKRFTDWHPRPQLPERREAMLGRKLAWDKSLVFCSFKGKGIGQAHEHIENPHFANLVCCYRNRRLRAGH
jgi:hypothetical protein